MDEINDQTDQMEQIQQAMGQPIGSAADIDEDDLLNELEVRMLSSLCFNPPGLGGLTAFARLLGIGLLKHRRKG